MCVVRVQLFSGITGQSGRRRRSLVVVVSMDMVPHCGRRHYIHATGCPWRVSTGHRLQVEQLSKLVNKFLIISVIKLISTQQRSPVAALPQTSSWI